MTENTRLMTFIITIQVTSGNQMKAKVYEVGKKNSGFDCYSGGQIMTTVFCDGIRNSLFL